MPALSDLIEAFAAKRGIDPPAPDPATGGFGLALGDRHLLRLHELGAETVAVAWLDDLPEQEGRRSEVVRRLMKRELAHFGDDDLVLSVDETAGALRLHERVTQATLDVDGLTALLQRLVDGVERRRAGLRGRRRTLPAAPLVIRP